MRACAGLCLLLSYAANASAQEQTPKRGFNPGESYAISDIETISTTGGNLSLRLPLGGLPSARGGLKASVNLVYNSKLWDSYPFTVPAPTEDVTDTDAWHEMRLRQSDDGGWRYAFKYKLKLEYRHLGSETGYCQTDGGPAVVYVYKLFLILPDGSKHEMHLGGAHTGDDGYTDIMPDGNVAPPPTQPCSAVTPEYGTLAYYSSDGTYLRLEIQHDADANWENNPWTLYLPDGGRVTGGNAAQRIYDRNNNFIEIVGGLYNNHAATYLNDQVGRSVIVEYGSAANQDSVHVRGTNNELLTWNIVWGNIQVNKSYQAGSPHTRILATNMRVVSQIKLPAQAGGLSYNFAYNAGTANPSHGWGEVSSVTLPTGARASYQYLRDGANNIRTQKVLGNHPARKDLVYRPEYDGAAVSNTPCDSQMEATCVVETWTYGITFDAAGEVVLNGSVTNPGGGVARDHVTIAGDVYKSERPDGSVVERQWQSNIPYGALYGKHNPYVKREFTSIRDAAGNLTKTAIKEYEQDKNGNLTQAKEYDWVAYSSLPRDAHGMPHAIPPGAQPLRATASTYNNPTPDASDTTTNDADAYYNPTAPRVLNAVATSEVSNGAQTLSRSEFGYDNAATTANPTVQKNWDSQRGAYSNPLTDANSVSVSTQYNSYGSPTLSIDARGTQTRYIYEAVNGHVDLYPTKTKVAEGTAQEQLTTQQYDFYTGAVTRTVDPNGVATAINQDAFARTTLVKAAEGIAAKEARTATEYSDVLRRIIVRSDLSGAGDGKLVSVQHFDQLGRTRLTRQLEDAATQSATSETSGIKVQMRYLYSGAHSYQLVSNPYRAQYAHQAGGEPSMGWTRGKVDGGGRAVETQSFNGATLPAPWGANASTSGAVTTHYDAEFTTVTDQSANPRRSMSNGLGQLVRVDEPDKTSGALGPNDAPVQPTFYAYDALNNLNRVTQGAQARTFDYSSLSRLISANNPESGTVIYNYDAGGNLLSKTDALGITSVYSYDALSRNTTVDYSNTTVNPDITRFYDNPAPNAYGRGRYWYDWKGGDYTAGSEVEHRAVDAYDALGRPLTQRQMFKTAGVWSAAYTTSRTYTRSGNVETQTLPSGHTASYSHDAAGRVSGFTGNLGDGVTRAYASNATYDEAGRLKREQFGTETPLYHKRHYNTRGQLYDVRLSSDAVDEWSWNRGAIVAYYDSNYSWSNRGNAPTLNNNNGNVTRMQAWVPGDDAMTTYALSDQYFAYDKLNRLKSMNEYKEATGVARVQTITQAYDYDRWGNRTINQAATTQTLAPEMRKAFTVDTATNRLGVPAGQLGAMIYNASGNLTHDSYTGKGERTFDAENRMTGAAIGVNSSSSYAYDADGRRVRRRTPTENVWQVYGMDGELLAEYAAQAAPATPQKEYGYRGGELLITAAGNVDGGSGSSGSGSGGASAIFVKSDTTTQGSWKGRYGAEGYALVGDAANYPAYAQVGSSGANAHVWATSTTDARGLQKAAAGSSAERVAATLYSATSFTFDLNLTDGKAHQVAIYCLDWDHNNARRQRVEVIEAATGALLGSRDMSAYTGGQYLVWSLRGHVKLKIIYTGAAGLNATVSALFFDAARVNMAAAAQGATATASSVYPGGAYAAASTINGDRKGLNWGAGGGWHDGTQSLPDWLEVDFGGARTINEIDVFTVQDNYTNPSEPVEDQQFTLYGLTGFEVQYWTGSVWAAIPNGSVTGNNRVWRKFTFLALTTQKIRILTTASKTNDGYSRLTEVEAYAATPTGADSASVQWLVTDQLGTPRLIADASGSLSGMTRHDYMPFGEEIGAGTGGRTTNQGYSQPDDVRQQFTGKERDDETGLDYFLARYHSSTQGRFTSVDPLPASARRVSPQSWNRYAFTYNNPLRFVDPNGEEVKVLSEEALKRIRQTLPENIRDKVELDANGLIDKNGLSKIKSDDQNFQALKMLVNDKQTIEVGTVAGVEGIGEFSYQSVEDQRKEVIENLIKAGVDPTAAAEVAKEINIPVSFLGYTLSPEQTDTGNMRVLISNGMGAASTAPQEEIVITAGHELYGHAALFVQGKAWLHDDRGPVNAHIKQVEDRTMTNFQRQKTTPSHQQPKKPPQ
jgi:RHS repeat-associated protein